MDSTTYAVTMPAPMTFGERVSDMISTFGGSWIFVISFNLLFAGWVILNSWIFPDFLHVSSFDAYPFILLNLGLSYMAAMQAPIIMMSNACKETRYKALVRVMMSENHAMYEVMCKQAASLSTHIESHSVALRQHRAAMDRHAEQVRKLTGGQTC